MLLNWTLGIMVQGAQGAKDVHHAIGISHQRNSGYRQSKVNISWHKVSPLPSHIPSLSPYTPLSKKVRSRNNYTHHEADGVAQHYTSPFPRVVHWASL